MVISWPLTHFSSLYGRTHGVEVVLASPTFLMYSGGTRRGIGPAYKGGSIRLGGRHREGLVVQDLTPLKLVSLPLWGLLSASLMRRSKENLTAAELIGSPLWKVAPLTRVNFQVRSSTFSHFSTIPGLTVASSCGLRMVS